MKWLSVLLIVFLPALQAHAQIQSPETADSSNIQLGPQVGMDLGDVTDPYVGIDARIATSKLSPLVINPSFDYFFMGEGQGLWALSGNLLYPFGAEDQSLTFYGGTGLGIYRFSVEGEDPDSPYQEGTAEVGANFLIGLTLDTSAPLVPFGEFKFTTLLANPSPTLFGVEGGVLIRF